MIRRLTGWKDTKNDDLKDALRNLVDTKVEYNILKKDSDKRGIFAVLSNAELEEQGRGKKTRVTFEFPDKLLQAVKHPSIYVRLNLLVVRGLESKHSIALYEFLKDYINLHQLRVDVDDFRNLMGIQPGQYKYFTMLRKRVLDKSVEEINDKTDIEVNFDLETEGRKFTAIVFHMKPKEQSSLQYDTHNQIIEKLISLGVKKAKANQLLEKHDEQYLWANISIVEEQAKKGEIKNVTAYLLKAFEHDFRPTVTELDQLRAEKDAAEQARMAKLEEMRRAEEEQKKSFEEERRKKLEGVISSLSAEELENLREEFSNSLKKNPVMEKILKAKGIETPMLQPQRENFLAERFLASYFHRFVSYDKKKAGRAEE